MVRQQAGDLRRIARVGTALLVFEKEGALARGLIEVAVPDEVEDVPGALLELLGASDAATVLVAVDDLVLETDPQNVPGTGSDRPNWVRMLPCTLPELFDDPSTAALLRRLQGSRLGAHARAAEEAR